MIVRSKGLSPGSPVATPRQCNVFNFTKADINGDNLEETILINSSNQLVILSSSGEQLWKATRYFGATTKFFRSQGH